jgi:segregation and condensation protein A
MPRDLYIPPQALEVFLEAFEGPLDLLLYLIRRQNLDMLDIPIAEITRQYMQLHRADAGPAARAGRRIPGDGGDAGRDQVAHAAAAAGGAGDGEEDPRAELVRRLQEYERFKRAAADVDALPRLERDVWQASAELRDRPVARVLPQVTLRKCCWRSSDVATRAQMFAHHHVQREPLSVRERMSNVLAALEQGELRGLRALFTAEEGRMGVTVTFVAILELLREGLIDIVQTEALAPLHVRRVPPVRTLQLVPGIEQPDGDPQETGRAADMNEQYLRNVVEAGLLASRPVAGAR